jgi:hypothetical protein
MDMLAAGIRRVLRLSSYTIITSYFTNAQVQYGLSLRTAVCKPIAACTNLPPAEVRHPRVICYCGGISGHLCQTPPTLTCLTMSNMAYSSGQLPASWPLLVTIKSQIPSCHLLSRWYPWLPIPRQPSNIRSDIKDNTTHSCLSDHAQHTYTSRPLPASRPLLAPACH